MGLGSGIREKTYSGSRIRVQGSKRHRIPDPDPHHWIFIYKNIPGISFNTFWNTEMPHLDKHWIAGVLVGLELFAVSVKQDGLGP
jgi:hypothetical protein